MKAEYIRKKNVILSVAKSNMCGVSGAGQSKEIEAFPSIAKAKKASWKLQKLNGGLGAGYVVANP